MRGLICLSLAAYSVASADKTEPGLEHDTAVRLHMHENFDLLRGMEKLLIRGRLDEAKQFARAIADAPDEPGLGTFAPYAVKVRDRAAELATAKTIEAACTAEAQLAAACAGCHVAASVTPQFANDRQAPADKPTIQARMTRHLWATDRLWEGLVGASDTSWQQGLDVLAAPPSAALPASRQRYAKRLQQQADAARKRSDLDDLDARAKAYGDMLTTCAGCHTAK